MDVNEAFSVKILYLVYSWFQLSVFEDGWDGGRGHGQGQDECDNVERTSRSRCAR